MCEESDWNSDVSGENRVWDQETHPELEEAFRAKITHLIKWFQTSDSPENEGQFEEDLCTEHNADETIETNGELYELISTLNTYY